MQARMSYLNVLHDDILAIGLAAALSNKYSRLGLRAIQRNQVIQSKIRCKSRR